MLDRQKAFNTAYHGLAAQGFERSMGPSRTKGDADQRCAYRAPDGKRCALGYMIPDAIYSPKIEGYGPARLPDAFWDYIGGKRSENAHEISSDEKFLADLQRAHDESITPDTMKFALAKFARQYGLTIPTLPVTPDAPVSEDAKVERIAINA